MSGFISLIGAAADEAEADAGKILQTVQPEQDSGCAGAPSSCLDSWKGIPAHDFTGRAVFNEGQVEDDPLDRNPDLWQYRRRTVGLLRRYLRFSLETGRLPSVMGREFFRAKMTSYSGSTFEDRVIFVRDVEMCLDRLKHWDRQLVARVILQEHDQFDAARMLHCGRATLQRRLYVVLDLLSEDFLRVRLLVAVPAAGEVSQ